MKDPLRSRGVVSEPRVVKQPAPKATWCMVAAITAERDEARSNFGRALAAGAKAEQERDAALVRAEARERDCAHWEAEASALAQVYGESSGAEQLVQEQLRARVAELEEGLGDIRSEAGRLRGEQAYREFGRFVLRRAGALLPPKEPASAPIIKEHPHA